MKNQFLILVSFVTLALPAVADDEWDTIKAAIIRRREAFPVFESRLLAIQTDPATMYGLKEGAPQLHGDTVVFEHRYKHTVDLQKVRFRLHSQSDIYFDGLEMFVTRNDVRVHDGKLCQEFYPYGQPPLPGDRRKVDLNTPRRGTPILNGFEWGPLLWQFGIFGHGTRYEMSNIDMGITDLDTQDVSWARDGSRILMIGKVGSTRSRIVFDGEQEWNVVQWEMFTEHPAKYSMEYEPIDGVKVLKAFRFSGHTEMTATITEFQRTKVTDDQFKVPDDYVKPGMFVGKNGKILKVAEDGTLVPRVPRRALPPVPD